MLMIKFITDILNSNEPDILSPAKHSVLLIISIDHQLLNRFESPVNGWTHEKLCDLNSKYGETWNFCGADAYLGGQWVGSTEV
jgi:5'-deoxynucleotidase